MEEDLDCETTLLEEDPHGYISLPTGEVIKKEWLEVYEFCQYHKAPFAWSKVFDHVESMSLRERKD
jgi:hypothetical protein